jgi:hypothetical protein
MLACVLRVCVCVLAISDRSQRTVCSAHKRLTTKCPYHSIRDRFATFARAQHVGSTPGGMRESSRSHYQFSSEALLTGGAIRYSRGESELITTYDIAGRKAGFAIRDLTKESYSPRNGSSSKLFHVVKDSQQLSFLHNVSLGFPISLLPCFPN